MINLPFRGGSYSLNPGKILALGLNYREHINESHSVKVRGFDKTVPEEPVVFPKAPTALIGSGSPIVVPAFVREYSFEDCRTDYEAELAFVIARDCRNVPESEASDYVLGYTCLNDVSQRNLQTGDKSGWFRGKSLDTFCPAGPVLVPPEEIGDPMNLDLECRLNGRVVQKSSTAAMIFSVPQIISILSRWFTLKEGDLISTGTPAGVGPIHNGDIVEVEIKGIGVLSNPVREE